jgi:isoleucyl-tRNA synthetase
VGDVWLDAGIVPFSTLGWQNDEWVEGGYATGASRGISNADLPDHAYWEQWFPADWVSEMREQIRLWFYSQLFMSVALVGRPPFRSVLGYEKMLDEHGREMHGSWGNMIEAEDAFARMGADVMRWQYCAQPPDRNLLFGFGPAREVKRKLLTLWNSVKFLVDYGRIERFRPSYDDLSGGPAVERPLDRWLVARTDRLVRDATDALEAQLTYRLVEAFERYVDDLSNWYIRRSRRRFWDGDDKALRVLWYGVVQALRVISPVMPFLAEHLWQNVVRGTEGAPDSVFLAGWPEVAEPDVALLDDVAEVRRVVELGRKARDAARIKHRQPLGRLVVQGARLAGGHTDEIAEELRVKEVEFGDVEAQELVVKPNLPVLGPKLGRELGAVRAALAAGDFEELDDGRFRAAGHELGADEVLVERRGREGWEVVSDAGLTVALDTALDDELRLEGQVLDLIHRLNSMRKQAGLELTDRITVTLPADQADLLAHAEWIKSEVLAVEIEADGGGGEPSIAKV